MAAFRSTSVAASGNLPVDEGETDWRRKGGKGSNLLDQGSPSFLLTAQPDLGDTHISFVFDARDHTFIQI